MRPFWRIIFSSVAVLGLALFVGVSHFKAQPEPEEPPYIPTTWSKFTQKTQLTMLLTGFSIEKVIDIPSADVADFLSLQLGLSEYIGVTDTPERARELQVNYGSASTSFAHFDITGEVLPRADLIIVWDKLSTLSPAMARAALHQLKKSGAKFLLAAHNSELKQNNLQLPPYNFPKPIIQMENLALWKLENLP